MKSTLKERASVRIQVALINAMYWEYWTYWCVYSSLYVYFPLYLSILFMFRKIKTFKAFGERLDNYYRNIAENTTIPAYNKNKINRKYEIRQRLKRL